MKNYYKTFEENKHFLADYLSKKLKKYPKIIADSLSDKTLMNITENEIFICVKLLELYKFNVSVYDKEILNPTGLVCDTKHTFAKIKEGLGEFSDWMDYPGIDKRSIKIAIDYAEKNAREKLADYIGESGKVVGVLLKNDDYKFDVNLECEFKSDYDIRDVDIKTLAKELMKLTKNIKERSKGKIKRVYATIESELELKLLGNSAGGLTFQKIPRTNLVITTVAYPKRIVDSHGFIGKKTFRYGACTGLDIFYDIINSKNFELDDFLNNITEKSIDFFYNSIPIEKTGFKTYQPIKAIFHPHAAGIFTHEALGHHVEQDLEDEYYGARFLRDYIGQKVSNENTTILFDPMHSKDQLYPPYGSYFYDDEGTIAMKTPIIENGVSIDTLNDLTHAKLYNIKPNGHCLNDYIRMSNLVIDDRDGVNPEDLFDKIKGEGFYIEKVHGGYTGEITKQARIFVDSLYFIDKNKNLIPINLLSLPASKKRENLAIVQYNLSIDSFDILHKVKMIGKNRALSWDKTFTPTLCGGHCGKEGETTPTAEGGAYLLIEDLLLTKNELDAPRKCLFLKSDKS